MGKGGYQIIDFKKHSFVSENPVVIKGIYNLIKNTSKPIIITGLVFDNIYTRDIWANFQYSSISDTYVAVIVLTVEGELITLVIIVNNKDRVITQQFN